jgi:hypothetical protein
VPVRLPVGIAYNPSKLDLFASCAFAWLYALTKGHSGLTLARNESTVAQAAIGDSDAATWVGAPTGHARSLLAARMARVEDLRPIYALGFLLVLNKLCLGKWLSNPNRSSIRKSCASRCGLSTCPSKRGGGSPFSSIGATFREADHAGETLFSVPFSGEETNPSICFPFTVGGRGKTSADAPPYARRSP